MVNWWNKVMVVGLCHNHDISFIATQQRTLALVYYITNYTTTIEKPSLKRAAVAAMILQTINPETANLEHW